MDALLYVRRSAMVLLFDLDNTLIDSEAAYRASLLAAGVDPGSAGYAEARAQVKRRLGEGHPGARNRLLYFKQREEQGGPAAPQAVLEVMERYERALEQEFRQQWRTLERAALLERLTAHGPAAIVSDENTRTQLLKLRALDPQARFFRWIVTSEEVGAEKATGRPFEEALGRIGCAASECVMVGDSVESDLAPALRLGMRAVLTREFIGPKGAVPEGVAIIDRLDDLPQVLAR